MRTKKTTKIIMNIATNEELLTPDPRNAEIMATIAETPYTIYKHDKHNWCILVGNILLVQGIETAEEAKKRIDNFCTDYPMLIGTITAIAKIVIEEKDIFNSIPEQPKN